MQQTVQIVDLCAERFDHVSAHNLVTGGYLWCRFLQVVGQTYFFDLVFPGSTRALHERKMVAQLLDESLVGLDESVVSLVQLLKSCKLEITGS